MSEELAHCITPNLEGQVIFSQGFLPLAFDDPTPNYKAAVSVTLDKGPLLGTINRTSRTQVF
jgi:hypothetical protein